MITKMTNYYSDGVAECGMNTAEMLWWTDRDPIPDEVLNQ